MMRHASGLPATLAMLACIVLGAAAASPDPQQLSCILANCGAQATACLTDAGCTAAQDCFAGCAADDAVCSNLCFFSTGTKLFGELALCSSDNGCTPPTLVGNQTCPDFEQSPAAAAVDLSAALVQGGVWYVAGGANRGYDCLPCQVALYQERPDGSLSVRGSSFVNGKLLDITWETAEPGGGALDLNYTLFESLPVEERWRVVDVSDDGDFILLLICSTILGGSEYVGSQVYSTTKNATISADVAARFDAAIQEAGLADALPAISGYCSINYSASCQYADWLPVSGPAASPAAGPVFAPAPVPAAAGPSSAAARAGPAGGVGALALAAAAAALLL
ncbi:hypothetical protein ABPG75_011698 [Micractinium tetrahymenae]